MVEKVQNDMEEVKTTQSAILSAPTTDESMGYQIKGYQSSMTN